AATGRLTGSGTCTTGLKIGAPCFDNSDCLLFTTPGTCTGGGGVAQKFGEFQGSPGLCADPNTSSCNIDVSPLGFCAPAAIQHPDHPANFIDTAVPGFFCQGDPLTINLPCTTDSTCQVSPNSGGSCSAGIFYYVAAAFTNG